MQETKFPFFFFILTIVTMSEPRSIHRPQNETLPTITTSWEGDPEKYRLCDSHWERYPIFQLFEEDYFRQHLLPPEPVLFRNNDYEKIDTALLNRMLEGFVAEINQHKRKYTDFAIIQNKDFNRRRGCGLLIVKCKRYPFVVKMFIETPKSFIDPWCKGREPVFFFYMGGGVNRHLTGLTRIKNLEQINGSLQTNVRWRKTVSTPRKWYWLPRDPRWIIVEGKHVGPEKEVRTRIPGIYAIVADYIQKEKGFSLLNTHDRVTALDLCNDLGMLIDPHIQNFFIEKGTKKIVIVDTEHFPTVVGFKEKKRYKSYFEWYLGLSGICAKNMFFRTKNERIDAQTTTSEYALM